MIRLARVFYRNHESLFMGYIEFEPNAIHSNGAKLYILPPVTIVTIVCQFVSKISTQNTYSLYDIGYMI